MLTERLNQRQVEKEKIVAQLAVENNKKICLSEEQILCFLNYICEMPFDDAKKSRALINIFVNSVYLYDDYFTIIINASRKPIHIDNIPLDDIEAALKTEKSYTGASSSMTNFAPPKNSTCFGKSNFFIHCEAMVYHHAPACILI